MHNFNIETQLPYGVIQGNSLDGYVLDLLCEAARTSAYLEAEAEKLEELGVDGEVKTFNDLSDEELDEFNEFMDSLQIDEPAGEVILDNVKVQVSWLGGAVILFSLNGPVTKVARYCSPCVPGAADLNSGVGDIECHGVPTDWFYSEDVSIN